MVLSWPSDLVERYTGVKTQMKVHCLFSCPCDLLSYMLLCLCTFWKHVKPTSLRQDAPGFKVSLALWSFSAPLQPPSLSMWCLTWNTDWMNWHNHVTFSIICCFYYCIGNRHIHTHIYFFHCTEISESLYAEDVETIDWASQETALPFWLLLIILSVMWSLTSLPWVQILLIYTIFYVFIGCT